MLILLTILALPAPLPAQDATVPADAKVITSAEGRGVQIYRCTESQWTFVAPEATLFDLTTHKKTGTHGAGPSWNWSDGSSISGKLLQKSPSPDVANIPWLLLAATPTGAATGILSKVILVRRWETHDGIAPSGGCDKSHEGATARIPYTALYTFYGPSGLQQK